jgi:hypothetical protein
MRSQPIDLNRPSSKLSRAILALVAIALILQGTHRLWAHPQTTNSQTAPQGWMLQGDHRKNYTTGVDQEAKYQGRPSAYLKSTPEATEGFGTLMQQFDAKEYVGKRVRFSAWVKSENLSDWAGLWMRVDNSTRPVAFDNMQNRAITGTTDWQNYSVVLDVPQDATGIFFGILLTKSGNVWLNSVKVETVGEDVPVTDMWSKRQDGPTNLNFDQ